MYTFSLRTLTLTLSKCDDMRSGSFLGSFEFLSSKNCCMNSFSSLSLFIPTIFAVVILGIWEEVRKYDRTRASKQNSKSNSASRCELNAMMYAREQENEKKIELRTEDRSEGEHAMHKAKRSVTESQEERDAFHETCIVCKKMSDKLSQQTLP